MNSADCKMFIYIYLISRAFFIFLFALSALFLSRRQVQDVSIFATKLKLQSQYNSESKFIHSFNTQYLLSMYYVSHIILGTRHSKIKKKTTSTGPDTFKIN